MYIGHKITIVLSQVLCVCLFQFKIRKEALMGLGQIYKKCTIREDGNQVDATRVAWIRNKVLHTYYQNSMDDRSDLHSHL